MDKVTEQDFGIKVLDMNTKRFQANGVWYNVSNRISTGRYATYQKATASYGFGMNVKGILDFANQMWAALEKVQFATCAALCYNLIEGFIKIQNDEVQAFEICTLFINADGEDARFYDENLAQKKIADWMEAGLDTGFFLQMAANSVAGYKDVYEKLSLTISKSGKVLPSE